MRGLVQKLAPFERGQEAPGLLRGGGSLASALHIFGGRLHHFIDYLERGGILDFAGAALGSFGPSSANPQFFHGDGISLIAVSRQLLAVSSDAEREDGGSQRSVRRR